MGNVHALVISRKPQEVDDFCQFTLASAGCTCSVVSDAPAAVARLAQEQPDLLFFHYTAPADLWELGELDRGDVLLPTVLILSEAVEAVPVRMLDHRLHGYLTLPAEPEQVKATLQRCVVASQPRYEQILLQQRLREARQELTRQSAMLATIYGLGRAFATMLDTDQLLDHVLETVVHLMPADEASVLLAEGRGERSSLHMACSHGIAASERRLRIEDSLAEMVMQTGQPLMIAQLGQHIPDGRDVDHPKPDGRHLHALLDVPLRVWERPIGVLSIVNKTSERAFSDEDRFLLTVLADYAAIAIENARLCSDSQHTAALDMFRQTVATLSHYINNPLMSLIAGVHTTVQHIRNLRAEETPSAWQMAPVLRNLDLIEDKVQEIATVLSVLREVVVPTSTEYWRGEQMIDIEKHLRQKLADLQREKHTQ